MSETSEDSPQSLARRIGEQGLDILRPRLLTEPSALPLKPTRGDYDLNPSTRPPTERTLQPAAVLLPIIRREEPTVLFTERTAHLSRHAGQVSFPGGRVQDSDLSLVETALRETKEETGIAASFVSVAGFLDPYETGTGFAILPVVGMLTPDFVLVPQPSEVAAVFEVPLAFLLDETNRQTHSREWQGVERKYFAYTYDGHYIWGATAAILNGFAQRLRR